MERLKKTNQTMLVSRGFFDSDYSGVYVYGKAV